MFSCNRTPSASHVVSLLSPLQFHHSQARGTLVCATLQARQTAKRGRQLPPRPQHIMEAMYIKPWEEDGVLLKAEGRGKSGELEEGATEASSRTGSTTEEETDEDSEPEPPSVVRRKVSFADAFGLNLVSVKEFNNAEETESDVSLPPEREATLPLEEFYMSCLFTVPSSPEELDQRLQAQMVELESIELLPGTTTIRGIVRVVNLCFSKSVYARMSLDRWASFFDLLAEYVPGSSDRKTDRFTFKYTLIPPFEREGTRLDICLRYETSVGTFWANNRDMNYVLFCHQRGHVHEHGPHIQGESASYRSTRSCLKANRRGSAEEKTRDTSNTSAVVAAVATDKAAETDRKTLDSTEIQSLLHRKEHKPSVDSIKSGRRATRLARVQDYLSQRRQHIPESDSHDSGRGQKASQPLPTLWGDPASFLHKRQKKQSNESPQALTYHEIPLLTLDWNSDKAHRRGSAHVDDIWDGTAKMTLSTATVENIEDPPSVNDMWEAFLNGTDDITGKETSVCDAWQAFLNGPSCTNHSAVRESEWLQTAASVSPSNDNGAKTKYAASSQGHEFQVGADAPATLRAHTSAACQLLPEPCETSPANVALNAADHQPAEACVSSPGDDNTTTRDASQRSETNSVTDTPQEFSLEGATPVSKGSVDSSTECHKQATWERERDGIIESAEGIGKDEPFTPNTADFVTSSGELETTDMTAKPESQNASAVDRISQGARLAEGLSSSGEGQGTGTSHNATGDTLAFRGTIRQGTKDGERFVFSTSRRGAEEGKKKSCTENEVVTGEEIFRPQKTEECEISQRYADEKHREEFRLNRNSENPLAENESDANETRPAQSHTDEFNPNQTCDETFERSQIMASESKSGESENGDAASKKEDLEVLRKAQVSTSYCTTREETKRVIGAGVGIIQVLNEGAWQRNDEAHDKQTRSVQAGEVEDNDGQKAKTGEHVLVSSQTEEGKCSSSERVIEDRQEINLPTQTRHKKVIRSDHDTFPTDKCNPHPLEMVEMRQTHSKDDLKDQEEDAGHETSTEEVTAKEIGPKKDTSTDLQRRAETLERIEEDMSQRGKDERVSIGKLKIEAPGELMGNVGNPQGERRSAPAQLKEQELSAEVESSPRVECKKLSEGTKDPLTAENTAPLEVIESGVEERFIERFGEDLVRGVWEEVFDLKAQASDRDASTVDGAVGELVDTADITPDRHLPFEKDSDDAFDSGVFSLTELPPDPNSSLCRGLEQTIATESDEYSPNEKSQSLFTIEQTHFLSESQTDSNSSAPLSQDLILAAGSRLIESAQSPPSDQGNYAQIKAPSVSRQGTGRQIEESAVARRERFNRSVPRERSPSEKLKESDSLVWWSVLYILGHVIRLIICALLVAGFFFVVFMWDFPAFSALYGFSLSWWFYKWKRHRAMANKGMVG